MILENSLSILDELYQSIIITNTKFEVIYLNEYFKHKYGSVLNNHREQTLENLFNSNDLQQLKYVVEDLENKTTTVQLRLRAFSSFMEEESIRFSLKGFPFIPDGLVLIDRERVYQNMWLKHFNLINTYSNDLLGVANEKFEVEFISPSVNEILGYTQEEFILIDPFTIVHSDDLENLKHKLFDTIHHKKDKLSIINRFRKKNGDYIWVENNLRMIYEFGVKDSFKIITVTRDITEKVNTQRALRDTKKLLEEAQELAKMGNWELNLETEELEWPLAMSLIYENDPGNPPKTGREFFKFVHPDDYRYVYNEYRQLFEMVSLPDGGYREFRFRIITGKGNTKFIKTRFRVEEHRRLVKGINIDVTTEAVSQHKLISTEISYRQLVELCPFGIGITKNQERIFVNKKLAEFFEVDPQEFIHYPLDAFATGETKSFLQERIRKISLGKKVDDYFTGTFYTAKTKAIKTFEIFTSEITWEGEDARLALIIDITELKNNQEKIVQSESMLRLAQDFAGISNWQLDLMVDANHLFEVDIPKFVEKVHEDDKKEVVKKLGECIKGIGPYDAEFRIKTKSGDILWVAEKGDVIKDPAGTPIKMFGVTRDITREKLKELELMQAKDIAEESYKNQEAFFSFMSHEIRTPLNAVLGLTDLLKRNTTTPKKKSEIIKALKNSSDNLMHIVDGLLDLTKSRANKYQLEEINFNVYELLKQLESSYRFLAHEKGIKFYLTINKNIPETLLGDMVKLYQILNNLLDNAVKFTHSGFIRLTVKILEKSKKNSIVQFKIADTGIGIPRHKMNQIFEPYYQLTFNAKKIGTGLGLTIVKNLLSQLKGTMSTESSPGIGTIFTLNIPFQIAAKSAPSKKITTFKEIRGKKILYIEDVETNQYLIQNLLELHNVKCDVASTGRVAMHFLAKKKYDLLLLDVQLPDINGYELLGYIRTTTLNASVPVIVFTADVTDTTRSKIIDHGVKDFIYKPFISNDLLEKITNAIKNADVINMEYYERILKKKPSKLSKAKEFILNDLDEFKTKSDLSFKKKDIMLLKKSIHKVKVTLKNINALKLLRLLERIQSKQEFSNSLRLSQQVIKKELGIVKKYIREYDSR